MVTRLLCLTKIRGIINPNESCSPKSSYLNGPLSQNLALRFLKLLACKAFLTTSLNVLISELNAQYKCYFLHEAFQISHQKFSHLHQYFTSCVLLKTFNLLSHLFCPVTMLTALIFNEVCFINE